MVYELQSHAFDTIGAGIRDIVCDDSDCAGAVCTRRVCDERAIGYWHHRDCWGEHVSFHIAVLIKSRTKPHGLG